MPPTSRCYFYQFNFRYPEIIPRIKRKRKIDKPLVEGGGASKGTREVLSADLSHKYSTCPPIHHALGWMYKRGIHLKISD